MKQTATERVLICLSASPSNRKVIDSGLKMAEKYHAELTALYVETTVQNTMSAAVREQLEENIKLVKDGGAHVVTTYGSDIAHQITQYAKTAGITKIVIGRPNNRQRYLLRKKDIVKQLLQNMPDVEIFMIPDKLPEYRAPTRDKANPSSVIRSTMISAGILAAATIIGLLLQRLGFTDANIITVFIMSVLVIAYLAERPVYGIAFSALSVIVFNFLFTEPRFTLMAYDKGYPVTFLVMFLAALLTSSITTKAKSQARTNAQRAYRTEVLLDASRNLQLADSAEEILNETAVQLQKMLGKAIVLVPESGSSLSRPALFGGLNALTELTKPDKEAIDWTLKNGEQTGAGTGIYSAARFRYLPIGGVNRIYGAIGIDFEGSSVSELEEGLATALLGECCIALDKENLRKTQSELMRQADRERLRANLLRAISHDLRTPLTIISGNAAMLMRGGLDETQRQDMYAGIYDDSVWLNNLVENLLSITKMDDSQLYLNMKPEVVSDVVEEAVSHFEGRRLNRRLEAKANELLLMARMDAALIVQVLVNLIGNAVKYTPEGALITISSFSRDGKVYISVADNGPGVPDENKPHIFDMFYTAGIAHGDSRRGLGLGLALCKSIITAHGGEITVSDNKPSGAVFTFSLIEEEVTLDE